MDKAVLLLSACVALASGQWLEATIPLPQSPQAVAWSPANDHVYCAVGYPDAFGAVVVIDGRTNAVLDTLMLPGQMPGELCVDAARNRVYCANSSFYPLDDSVVTVIDGATDSIVANIPVGSIPMAMCLNQDGSKLYCASQGQNAVFVIDCSADTVLSAVPVRTGPYALVYAAAVNKVYCACRGFYGRPDFAVSIIDCAVDTVCRNLGVGTFPTAICYNRADGKVYTADNFDGRVSIIDVFGDTLLNALGAGSSPGALVWNSANDRIYCGDDYAGLVTSIDGRTNGLHGSIVVAGAVWGLAVDSAANKVYCTNYLDDKVTVLDGVTETIVATVSVGAGPRSICHNEADGRTYAGAREGNSLAVIRDSTTGVAEGRAPAVNATSGPTLFSGALNDGLSGFGVVYDVQGRRTVAARPGVYFVREQARVRKAVVAR